jgi:hypothetical protein
MIIERQEKLCRKMSIATSNHQLSLTHADY